MPGQFHKFLADELGAITVDWVVLTGIAVGFGFMVLATLGSGTTDVGAQMQRNLGAVQVTQMPELGFSE
ncbi:hypothetical protein [Pararhodobacter sp.]|uniref:hypothetical protein n=1 Tax=Pararhodobacter sp. TaxID=2127056 RepID=UPI002AFF0594|nr:hypothetical protein [Pararhodobacter sp.]